MSNREPGICTVCGHDPFDWNAQDTAKTLDLVDVFTDEWGAPRLDVAQAKDPASALHQLWHHLFEATAGRPPSQSQHGTVSQLSASGGGVPKRAIDLAIVGVRGIEGDAQKARVHHGRPWQALCLWSAEVIETLVAEGHPVFPGAAGENITVAGVDWSRLRGGMQFTIGEVECQFSLPAVPCSKNAQWFLDGEINRMDHALHPGSSRWYASVITPGTISPGDPVVIGN